VAGAQVALAAPHPAALDAARQMVRAGGGAVDAAIAAAAALAVVYPHQTSVGGDLVALVRDGASGSVDAVLSAGAAPMGIDPAELRAAGERMPPGGPLSVTVPGVVDGWRALSQRWGRLPWADLLDPAIELARSGAIAAPGLVRAIAQRSAVIDADPGLSSLVRPGGATLRAGDTFRQPALAGTLEEIARRPRDFYDGPLAARIAGALAAFGSPMAADDLAAHRARLVPSLAVQVGGRRWSVAPPPTQGVALLATLLSAGGGGAGALVRSARAAELRRDAHLADPGTEAGAPSGLDRFLDGGVPPAALAGTARPAGDTVAVTAVDADGTAVSLISSVFQSFGSGLLDPETGVLFHNRGSAFSLDPAHPAMLRPGARPPHTLCPAVVESDGAVVALGCQGGRAQAWILSQIADGVDADDLDAVLRRPRWVIGSRDLGLAVPGMKAEPGVDSAATGAAEDLGLEVHHWSRLEDEAGHVQVARSRDGALDAASDPRADGSAGLL